MMYVVSLSVMRYLEDNQTATEEVQVAHFAPFTENQLQSLVPHVALPLKDVRIAIECYEKSAVTGAMSIREYVDTYGVCKAFWSKQAKYLQGGFGKAFEARTSRIDEYGNHIKATLAVEKVIQRPISPTDHSDLAMLAKMF